MSIWAIGLVVISAFLHAGWNILGKSNQSSGPAFFLATSGAAATLLTPYLIWYLATIGFDALPATFWQLLLVSGICQMIYLVGLAYAYKQADIGVIYPMARALPVLMVGLGTALLGYELKAQQWLGFVVITVGCLFVPLARFSELRLKAYLNLGVLWALVAAIGTTGYSIVDKEALLYLNQTASDVLDDQYSAVFYLGSQFWAMFFPMVIWIYLSGNSQEFGNAAAIIKPSALAGVMMATTYGLVLFAMTMTDNVSLVVALRQISIIFGLLMGIYILKEQWYRTRAVGVLCIAVGLILSLT
ncbi:EamA family transporter [Vibrio astriarenae]|uniref:EamA family transporter n=1 Tax=Vibrio astriarenae TaxID=1481923 RepID=A0A7Z2T7X1_9VIBR|nr:EamA family transporter [Vibrio astriarenae]QIA66013.1 EamA family transporter [Vibrio astriarenae]